MKKSLKTRLTLNRETLRNLNAEELTAAPGGATGDACPISPTQQTCIQTNCNCITRLTCPSNCGQYYC
jgi:hypothetical protein